MVAIFQWPPIKTQNTSTYLQVISEADSGKKDGAVSGQELQNYRQGLDQQVQMYSWFSQLFGNFPFWGDLINKQLTQLKDKQSAVNTMQENFGTFSNPNQNNLLKGGGGETNVYRPFDNTISYNDVWNVAGRDGNQGNVSDQDVHRFIKPIWPQPIVINDPIQPQARATD